MYGLILPHFLPNVKGFGGILLGSYGFFAREKEFRGSSNWGLSCRGFTPAPHQMNLSLQAGLKKVLWNLKNF
jgi:hypothetical protein